MTEEKRRIRLCVVSASYHPALSGLGRQAKLLTERLAEEGIALFVIARRMKGMPPAEFSPKVKVYRGWSIRPYIHNYEKVSIVNILISLTFSLSAALILLWKRRKYDIVHFHGASLPLLISLPVLKLLRKKVIAKVATAGIGTEAGAFRGRFMGLGNLFAWIMKHADMFIATTAEIEKGLLSDGIPSERIRRITNFIDTACFHPVSLEEKRQIRKSLGLALEWKIAICTSKFLPRKGIDDLLKAWQIVVSDHPEAVLLLLGEGPLLDSMKQLASELGISDRVLFCGLLPDVTAYLQSSDLFVLPSRQEGMPNALLEAMACGLPGVATRIGGVVDVIQDGKNGVLVPPYSPESLANAIKNLLANESLARQYSVNGLHTIHEYFSLDSIVKKYISLYKELIQ